MARSAQDALAVLRGAQLVAEALLREQSAQCKHIWTHSSLREILQTQLQQNANYLQQIGAQPTVELKKLQQLLQESTERSWVVVEGLRQLAKAKVLSSSSSNNNSNALCMTQQALQQALSAAINVTAAGGGVSASVAGSSAHVGGESTNNNSNNNIRQAANAVAGRQAINSKIYTNKLVSNQQQHLDAAQLDISSITLNELEEILTKRNKNRDISLRTPTTERKQVKASETTTTTEATNTSTTTQQTMENSNADERKTKTTTQQTMENSNADERKTKTTTTAKATSAAAPVKTTATTITPNADALKADTVYVENILKVIAGQTSSTTAATPSRNDNNADLLPPTLSAVAKQRRVPSSRLGRMVSFGSLFAGLGVGTINELTKGALGLGGSKNVKDALLSPANAERIVDTLCKVRGAALKIGQILSIQDANVVSPQLAKAFERVRQAADYMPDWQVERVMVNELGADWRERLASFDDKPFAAASIGQVHRATLKNGMQVAIKIQYPGVAQSIESDIDNLVGMLKVWDVFPQGFFIDNVVKVAKRELNWEVDYTREAEYTDKFKQMIAPYPEYYVPHVIKELSTSSVLTTELVPGVPLDKCFDLSYEHRHHIASSVLKLCLRELFELECMQTDPNWSNFLYDANTKRLMLIDFGSTRFYQKNFIKNYRQVIIHAVENNRDGVLRMSREMGFLTGYESKQMEEAHVDAVMILGEIFRFDGEFDFGRQNTTERIAHLVPTMVAHRLCPPPEEIYSIHRKLSGIFLLCARLNAQLNCRPFYNKIIIQKFKE